MFREQTETVYSDIPFSLVIHPLTGNIKVLKNTDSIKQSVKNIVLTNFFERPYEPYLGANLIAQLFNNIESSYYKFLIEDNIELAIQNYEPRANVLGVDVEAASDRNTLNVTVKFIPITEVDPISVSVIIERVR